MGLLCHSTPPNHLSGPSTPKGSDPVSSTEEVLHSGRRGNHCTDPSLVPSQIRVCKHLKKISVRLVLQLHFSVPWQKDGVVEEVLKNFEEDTVILLPVLLFGGLLASAARGLLRPCQVRLGGLCVVFHVCEPCRWDADWDLQFWFWNQEEREFSEGQRSALLHACKNWFDTLGNVFCKSKAWQMALMSASSMKSVSFAYCKDWKQLEKPDSIKIEKF